MLDKNYQKAEMNWAQVVAKNKKTNFKDNRKIEKYNKKMQKNGYDYKLDEKIQKIKAKDAKLEKSHQKEEMKYAQVVAKAKKLKYKNDRKTEKYIKRGAKVAEKLLRET